MSNCILASPSGTMPHSYVEFFTFEVFLYWQIKPAAIIAIANKKDIIINIDKQTSSFNTLPSYNYYLTKKDSDIIVIII